MNENQTQKGIQQRAALQDPLDCERIKSHYPAAQCSSYCNFLPKYARIIKPLNSPLVIKEKLIKLSV